MAQILKEEMRNRILEAAKKELLTSGYKDASMRRIAMMSHMTVGNLYRYFKNKDELIHTIISPPLEKINDTIKELTGETISFEKNEFDLAKGYDIRAILDRLGDALVDLYFEYQEEMQILMMHSKPNEELAKWFSSLIAHFLLKGSGEEDISEVMVLANGFSVSVFHGVQECFATAKLSKMAMKRVVRRYFHFFALLFEVDERMLMGV